MQELSAQADSAGIICPSRQCRNIICPSRQCRNYLPKQTVQELYAQGDSAGIICPSRQCRYYLPKQTVQELSAHALAYSCTERFFVLFCFSSSSSCLLLLFLSSLEREMVSSGWAFCQGFHCVCTYRRQTTGAEGHAEVAPSALKG